MSWITVFAILVFSSFFHLACGFGFSGSARVEVEGMGAKAMEDLQVGDMVLARNNQYQAIYAFGIHNPTLPSRFIEVETNSETRIQMTYDQLIFAHGKANLIRADSIRVGNELQGRNASEKVQDFRILEQQGVYAPLTRDGTIVVDGIVASCYSDSSSAQQEFPLGYSALTKHAVMHMELSPMRMLCFGISTKLCNIHQEDGMLRYIYYILECDQAIRVQSNAVQVLLAIFSLAIASVCMLIEYTLGAEDAVPVVSSVIAIILVMRMFRLSIRIKRI
jgi:hypothetical protein